MVVIGGICNKLVNRLPIPVTALTNHKAQTFIGRVWSHAMYQVYKLQSVPTQDSAVNATQILFAMVDSIGSRSIA